LHVDPLAALTAILEDQCEVRRDFDVVFMGRFDRFTS